MDFPGARLLDDPPAVFVVDSTSGQDTDSARCGLRQFFKPGQALLRPVRAACGQHPVHSKLAKGFQRGKRIRCRVECPVEGDARSAGRLDELGCSLHIYISIFPQYSQDDAIGSQVPGGGDIRLHDLDLERAVVKVAAARAYEHKEGNADPLSRQPDDGARGSDSAELERRAELDPSRTAELRVDGGLYAADATLK